MSNWAQLVIISFSSAVMVVGFLEMLKKIAVKTWILSKIAFISFRGRMLNSKNLKMGTSSKAQFTLKLELLVFILQRQTLWWAFCLFYCTRGLKHQ